MFGSPIRSGSFAVYRDRGRGREDGSAREENAQFLEVIERRYVLWVKPLVEKEDIEYGRQGQDPEQPYVLYSTKTAV